MPGSKPSADLALSFHTFGPFLRYLRKRARLTQRDLGSAVGYSIAQICLLEKGERLPELTTVAALFVPALDLQGEPDLVARLMHLAAAARGASRLTVTRTIRREITLREVETSRSGNLPAPLTSFIGREKELDSLRTLLVNPTPRLITLLGPPGVGKTRLALQLAWEICGDFADGAWFVDLVTVREPTFVATAVREVLGIRELSSLESDTDALRRFLHRRNTLLVIDNYEHVLSSAGLVADLLTAVPHLKILATSREPLDIYGESEFRVAPLPVPDLARLPALDEMAQIPSVALFVERALAVKPNFRLTSTDALATAAICVRLDGLPLALELAAARIKHLDPPDLAARLVQRLTLLERRGRLGHQTLRATVDWSYGLLTEAEQRLLRRCSVFAASFSLQAVQAICTDDQKQNSADAIRADNASEWLAHLVDKSLIMVEPQAGGRRYRLLETIREYALEKLAQAAGEEETRRRLVEFLEQLAESTEDLVTGVDQKPWLDLLETEHDNFRAALQWSLDGNAPEAGLRIAGALFRFWMLHGGHMAEGRRWTVRALAANGSVPSLARARALRGLAGLEVNQGEFDAACVHYRECLEIFQQQLDKKSVAVVTGNLGNALRCAGSYAEARVYLESSLAAHRELNAPFYVGYCLWSLAGVAYEEGDYANARRLDEQALSVFQKLGNQQYIAAANAQAGMLALVSRDYAAARLLFREALGALKELKDPLGILQLLEAIACLAVAEEEPECAATLHGAVESARAETGIYWHLFDADHKTATAQVKAMLDLEALERAQKQGRAMTLEQAIEYALSA